MEDVQEPQVRVEEHAQSDSPQPDVDEQSHHVSPNISANEIENIPDETEPIAQPQIEETEDNEYLLDMADFEETDIDALSELHKEQSLCCHHSTLRSSEMIKKYLMDIDEKYLHQSRALTSSSRESSSIDLTSSFAKTSPLKDIGNNPVVTSRPMITQLPRLNRNYFETSKNWLVTTRR